MPQVLPPTTTSLMETWRNNHSGCDSRICKKYLFVPPSSFWLTDAKTLGMSQV